MDALWRGGPVPARELFTAVALHSLVLGLCGTAGSWRMIYGQEEAVAALLCSVLASLLGGFFYIVPVFIALAARDRAGHGSLAVAGGLPGFLYLAFSTFAGRGIADAVLLLVCGAALGAAISRFVRDPWRWWFS